MRGPENFIRQPVRSLQTMLRVLQEQDPQYPKITPDGIYGPETSRAVALFQRSHGLPVTGVTDQPTWESIVSHYDDAVVEVIPTIPLEVILNPNQVFALNDVNPNIYILQAALTVLALAHGSHHAPPATGMMDAATMDALSVFQQLNALPMTGQLDKKTWNTIALQYPLASNILIRRDKNGQKNI